MADQDKDNGNKRGTAPYVGFPSYKNMLGGFKEHVLPSRIDRSVLGNFSGIVGSQLLGALKFFDHIDAQGKPTKHLEDLVAAHGTDDWTGALSHELRRAYGPVFALNLQSASPAQFTETFKNAYPAEGDTLRKALTFFLSAARDAQIPVSPFIMKNKKPRSGNGPKRQRAPKPAAAKADAAKPADPPPPVEEKDDVKRQNGGGNGIDAFKKDLLGKFPAFDPTWPDNIKAEWFKGFDQFMEMARK